MPLELDYYYGNEADQYSFYRIPKTLLTDHRYKSVSIEAKVLYGLMLDRMGLSVRNGWLDSDGRVYIYFTQEDAMVMLSCGQDQAVPGIGQRRHRPHRAPQAGPGPAHADLRQELHPAAGTRPDPGTHRAGHPQAG